MPILKSIGAVLAGAITAVALSLATDALMHSIHVFPKPGEPIWDSRPLALATAYRTLFGVLGAYVTARWAPSKPMLHAMILGTLGLLASIAGAVATWNHSAEYGPHWYPISLIVLAIPPAWLGAKLYESQSHSHQR